MHLLRSYIREAIDLGKVQFSPVRTDFVNKDEPNTPEEEQLYQTLKSRMTLGRHLSPTDAQTIIDLLDSKYGQAPGGSGFFSEPAPDQSLFRGHIFDFDWVKRHVSSEDIEKLSGQSVAQRSPAASPSPRMSIQHKLRTALHNKDLVSLVGYQFTPMRGWSKDPYIALDFAAEYAMVGDTYHKPEGINVMNPDKGQKGNAAVVLVTTPEESGARFLDLSNNMYRTNSASYAIRKERECINLGPVSVTQAAIVLLDRP